MIGNFTIIEKSDIFTVCKCDTCGEVFRRETSHLSSPHMCKDKIKNSYQIEHWGDFPTIRAEYKKLHKDAKLPTKSYSGDAGLDLYAISDIILPPGEITNIDTGIAISLPKGFYMTIEGRSSFYKNGLFPSRGIIDANYNGSCIIAMVNHNKTEHKIKKGERVAQLIAHRCVPLDLTEVDGFSVEYSERGTNGFGSSGKY